MSSALLVIDAQESFRYRPHFSTQQTERYLVAQNALIRQALATGIPIVRVLHVESDPESPFSLESGYVRPLRGLMEFREALTVHKRRHSALVGSGLDVWLTENGIRTLIISGIRTEQCCETTTRHASDVGYRVRFVMDATLTLTIDLVDGSQLSVDEIKHRTAAVLAGRFATICTVEHALETDNAH